MSKIFFILFLFVFQSTWGTKKGPEQGGAYLHLVPSQQEWLIELGQNTRDWPFHVALKKGLNKEKSSFNW